MAPRSDLGEVQDAWRALDHGEGVGGHGWTTIRVAAGAPCQVRAGRRSPGNEEALLVGFRGMRLPGAELMPSGRGFSVSEEDLGKEGFGCTWVALCRQADGSRELFGVMAEDVAGMLLSSAADSELAIFRGFLARIRAWQDFMQRGMDTVLSAESEVGLLGELLTLQALVVAGMSPFSAVQSWAGPLGGIHDFAIGNGAIEVKSTVASGSFPAHIGSLEQLDDDLVRPLYLLGARLVVAANGATLPKVVSDTRDLIDPESLARREFDSRLLHAGYIDLVAPRYTRRYRSSTSRIVAVSDGFPRLVVGTVPPGITRAQYEINLDLVVAPEYSLRDALISLGGIA